MYTCVCCCVPLRVCVNTNEVRSYWTSKTLRRPYDTNTRTQKHTHVYTYTYTHMTIHKHTHTHKHTTTHTRKKHIHTHPRKHTHTHTPKQSHTHTHTHVHTHTHSQTHTHTHTHTQMMCKMFINNRKSQEPPITIGTKFRSSATSLIRDWRCSVLRFLVFLCILRFRFLRSYSQRFRVVVVVNWLIPVYYGGIRAYYYG